jgi:hypothetical protein
MIDSQIHHHSERPWPSMDTKEQTSTLQWASQTKRCGGISCSFLSLARPLHGIPMYELEE